MLTFLILIPVFISAILALDQRCAQLPDNSIVVDAINCNVYYTCRNGNAYTNTNGNGYFDPALNKCVLGPNPLGGTSVANTRNPQRGSSSPRGTQSPRVNNSPNNLCLSQPDGTFLPHPTDCQSFNVCQGSSSSVRKCNSNYYFDIYEKRCLPGLCPNPICNRRAEHSVISKPNDNTGYYICHNGVAYPRECSGGDVFNGNTCVSGSNGRVDFRCIGQQDGSNVKHPSDCTRYFICNAGRPLPQICPNGQHFNEFSKSCIYGSCSASDSPCAGQPNGAAISDTSACDKYFLCDGGNLISQSCSIGHGFDPSAGTCIRGYCGQSNICSNKADDTYVANNQDCRSYYECQQGVAHLNTCPTGQAYNRVQQRCVRYAGNS